MYLDIIYSFLRKKRYKDLTAAVLIHEFLKLTIVSVKICCFFFKLSQPKSAKANSQIFIFFTLANYNGLIKRYLRSSIYSHRLRFWICKWPALAPTSPPGRQ